MSLKEKLKAVQSAVSAIEKQFGKGAIMALGEPREIEPIATIPTGSPSLDAALGCGGYPRGRIVEVFGPEASGKTTLTLHAIASASGRAASRPSSTPSTPRRPLRSEPRRGLRRRSS
jgi:recombination protein RecA